MAGRILFHLAAEVLSPVSVRLLQHIARAEVVWADETPLRVLDVKKTRKGYLWTFLTRNEKGEWLMGYRFSMGRAGKTPKEVLGAPRARSWWTRTPVTTR
ncbi:transposase [Archangium violaceum]|nr:transposase [Archangium violaceum]